VQTSVRGDLALPAQYPLVLSLLALGLSGSKYKPACPGLLGSNHHPQPV